ncbi:MAG: hypothetical protein H6Q68_3065 [Firmicutes bacterium]|nr:hypothetical protein [Bacillota bacterium]
MTNYNQLLISDATIILYLCSFVLEGPLRYILVKIGMEGLIYLRDVALVFLVLTPTINCLTREKFEKLNFYTLLFIAFYILIGILYTHNILQVLFGIKVILPFIVGIMYYDSLFLHSQTILKKTYSIFLVLVCTGIFLEGALGKLPWSGLSYNFASFEIEATRAWNTFGVDRLAGFSRSSVDAAIQILMFSMFLFSYVKKTRLIFFMWAVSGVAIVLTTSKGIILCYIFISIFLGLRAIFPEISSKFPRILIIPFILMIGLPLLNMIFTEFNFDMNVDVIYIYIFDSFRDRLTSMWPSSIRMVLDNGNILLGRGLGGIGEAQRFFEYSLYRPADNLVIYLYGLFGVASLWICNYMLIKAQKFDMLKQEDFFHFMILTTLVIYGITTSVMENSLFSLFTGFLWRKLYTL